MSTFEMLDLDVVPYKGSTGRKVCFQINLPTPVSDNLYFFSAHLQSCTDTCACCMFTGSTELKSHHQRDPRDTLVVVTNGKTERITVKPEQPFVIIVPAFQSSLHVDQLCVSSSLDFSKARFQSQIYR